MGWIDIRLRLNKRRPNDRNARSKPTSTGFPWLTASAALLLALDSLDQAGVDPAQSLGECRRVLKRNGLLLIRVSAHNWLKGPHDVAFNTGDRQAMAELTAMLREQGFRPMRCTYANLLLAPPVIAVRLMQQQGCLPMFETMAQQTALDTLMAGVLTAEARWLRRRNLPFGLSLFVLARRWQRDQKLGFGESPTSSPI